jgi:hypothetical protein
VQATAQGNTPASGTVKPESDWEMKPTGQQPPTFTI